MESLIMTDEDKTLIETLVINGINKAFEKLPCTKHGETIVELKTKFENHCNYDKEDREEKKFRLDYWKVILTVITVTILVLQFVKKV